MVWAGQAESPVPVLVSALETSSSEGCGGGLGRTVPRKGRLPPVPQASGVEPPSCSCSVVPARFTWKEAKCN